MTLVKNNPVYFGNLFDELFNQIPATWGKDAHNGFSSIPANIHETTDGYHVELSAPGRNKEDFKINLDNNVLSISAEKKAEQKTEDQKQIRREFSFRSFKRSFTLDETVDAEKIQAKYENGVLQLQLPKKEQAQPKAKAIVVE